MHAMRTAAAAAKETQHGATRVAADVSMNAAVGISSRATDRCRDRNVADQ